MRMPTLLGSGEAVMAQVLNEVVLTPGTVPRLSYDRLNRGIG